MELRLTRRRFGQLAIASSAVAGLAFFADKTLAKKEPTTRLIGAKVKEGRLTFKAVDINNLAVITDITGDFDEKEKDLDTTVERILDLTSDDEDLIVISDSPAAKEGKKADKNTKRQSQFREISSKGKSSSRKQPVIGLADNETLWSIEVDGNSLLTIVRRKDAFGSNRIARVNRNRGEITASEFNLPGDQNFATLTQCPSGTIYASTTDSRGYTSIVRIDVGARQAVQLVQLNFNGNVWNNGLSGLACSPSGQLIALTAPRYQPVNNLYTVDLSTGALSLLVPRFDANRITFWTTKK